MAVSILFPPLHMMAPLGNWFAPELDGRRVVLSTTLQVANKPQLMQILPIRSNLFERPAGHGRGLLPQPILSSFLWFISRGKYLQPLPEATVRRYMLVLRSETKQLNGHSVYESPIDEELKPYHGHMPIWTDEAL
ncbi:hypothetical protein ACSS6W_009795 [Trichoderma asperelloides]